MSQISRFQISIKEQREINFQQEKEQHLTTSYIKLKLINSFTDQREISPYYKCKFSIRKMMRRNTLNKGYFFDQKLNSQR